MEPFVIRLLIVIGLIWLTQFLLSTLSIRQDIARVILVIVVIILLVFLLFGTTFIG